LTNLVERILSVRCAIIPLIICALPLLFRLLCGATALWLARNDSVRQQQVFEAVLTLLTRPLRIRFALPRRRDGGKRR
jgi:hypothetical protein